MPSDQHTAAFVSMAIGLLGHWATGGEQVQLKRSSFQEAIYTNLGAHRTPFQKATPIDFRKILEDTPFQESTIHAHNFMLRGSVQCLRPMDVNQAVHPGSTFQLELTAPFAQIQTKRDALGYVLSTRERVAPARLEKSDGQ